MRVSRISRGIRVSAAATAVAGTVLTAALITGCGNDTGSGSAGSGGSDEAERTAMALTRFRTAGAGGPSEVTVRLPSAGSGTVTVRAVADYRVHRAVGVYEVTDAGHTMRGLLAWDLEGVAVAGSPETASPGSRPAAPGPVTTAVQAARRTATLRPDQWTRHPYGTAPLDQALRLTLTVTADPPPGIRLPAESRRSWPHAPAISPKTPARPQSYAYSLDADGDLRGITADVAPGRKATIDFTATRARAHVPGAPWDAAPPSSPSSARPRSR